MKDEEGGEGFKRSVTSLYGCISFITCWLRHDIHFIRFTSDYSILQRGQYMLDRHFLANIAVFLGIPLENS